MKRTYTVAREGFLMNTYRKVGDKVSLHPRQAIYLVHAGQLEDPKGPPPPSVAEQAKAIFAEAKAAATAPSQPEPQPEHETEVHHES